MLRPKQERLELLHSTKPLIVFALVTISAAVVSGAGDTANDAADPPECPCADAYRSAVEYCAGGIRCARCWASVDAGKRVAFASHNLFGQHESGLTDAELAACAELARTIVHCPD